MKSSEYKSYFYHLLFCIILELIERGIDYFLGDGNGLIQKFGVGSIISFFQYFAIFSLVYSVIKKNKILQLTLISILIAFFLIELIGNFYLNNFAPDRLLYNLGSPSQIKNKNLFNKIIYTPHRYIGYIPNPNYTYKKNKHNAIGYRGDNIIKKKTNEFRIVCLGGSTTYTARVNDYKKSYPYLLEKELQNRGFDDITVINAGADSWSTWESLINFELRVLDLEPDMIVVYHSINDIHSRIVWPKEKYKSDNSGRRIDNLNLNDISNTNLFNFLFTYRFLNFYIRGKKSLDFSIYTNNPPSSLFWEFIAQYEKGNYPSGIFVKNSLAKILETNKPIYFKRNIENIINLAYSHNIKVVLSTFAYNSKFPDAVVASTEYQSAFKEHNKIIKTIAKEKDISLLDFNKKFPNDSSLYTDGRHVNEKGSLLKATIFAEHIALLLGKLNKKK